MITAQEKATTLINLCMAVAPSIDKAKELAKQMANGCTEYSGQERKDFIEKVKTQIDNIKSNKDD